MFRNITHEELDICSNTNIDQQAHFGNLNEVSVAECSECCSPDPLQCCTSPIDSDTVIFNRNFETSSEVSDSDESDVIDSHLQVSVDDVFEYCNDIDIIETVVSSPSFSTRLSKWAVECGVNHAQVNGLLAVLRSHECHSDLPCDARTLLKTPRKVSVERE